jgi:DNA-binding response OmpR family regulator
MAKILIVEDDTANAVALKEWLELEHHYIDVAFSGSEALHYFKSSTYELLILDRGLPDTSGIELCRLYKSKANGLVLMLTGMSSVDDRVDGLEAGADDYLVKPFEMKELLARVKSLLRRYNQISSQSQFSIKDISLDTNSRIVKRGAKVLDLTPREYEVLEYFFKNPNTVVSPDALLRRVWNSDNSGSPHAVYTCLNRLRKNLNAEDKEYLIKTVHGVGYRLEG